MINTRKLFASVILLTGMITLLAFAIPKQPQPKPEKELTVKMPLSYWELALTAINSPDDISLNNKKAVLQKMVAQLNAQIADSTKPKK